MVFLTGTKYLSFPNGIFSLFTYWNIIVHKDIQRQFYRLLGKSPQTSRVLGNKQGEQKFSFVMVRPCPPSFVYSFPNKDPFYTKETHSLFTSTLIHGKWVFHLHTAVTNKGCTLTNVNIMEIVRQITHLKVLCYWLVNLQSYIVVDFQRRFFASSYRLRASKL